MRIDRQVAEEVEAGVTKGALMLQGICTHTNSPSKQPRKVL